MPQAIKDLQAQVALQDFIIKQQKEEIRLLTIRLFGQKGEKLSPEQTQFLLEEASVSIGEVAKEADLAESKESAAPKRKRARSTNPGRATLPEHLERREVILAVPQDQRNCSICREPRPIIGYDVREELDCTPAKYFVNVIKREKLGAHCQEEQGVATAPAPAQIVPKSKLSNEFFIEALAKKYQQHQPVFRQCANLLEDHGIDLSRQTLTESILAAGELLGAVVRAQAEALVAGTYLQADETRVPCQVSDKPGRNHTAWFHQYSVPGVMRRRDEARRLGPQELAPPWQRKRRSKGGGHHLDRGNLPPLGSQSEGLPQGRASQAWAMARQPGS